MPEHTTKLVDEIVEIIFQNRREKESFVNAQNLGSTIADHASRNMMNSGYFRAYVGQIHGEFLQRVIDQSLDELAEWFRQAGRQDGILFWNLVEKKLSALSQPMRNSLEKTAVSYLKSHGGLSATDEIIVTQSFGTTAGRAITSITKRVKELRVRSQFITMKSPQDRKANSIPDVAVMMWFPATSDGEEAVNKAKDKYQTIKTAVEEASNGLATVDRIDNPTLVHKDRISPSVESWIEKAVLVICDLEGNRANVFYEFGYARAIGTEVIATRPKGEETAFHLAQWNIDEYSSLLDLKEKIIPRLKTVLSRHDLSGST